MSLEKFPGENEARPTPMIELSLDNGEKLLLNWYNTMVRTFNVPMFNHLEHKLEDGKTVGIRVTEDFLEYMKDEEFPTYNMPYVDEATYNWYFNFENGQLTDDIEEFEDTPPPEVEKDF